MHQNTQIKDRLKEERKRLAWTQAEAAQVAGVRREMWARYEAGADPGATELARMAAAGMDVLYIITGTRCRTGAITQPAVTSPTAISITGNSSPVALAMGAGASAQINEAKTRRPRAKKPSSD